MSALLGLTYVLFWFQVSHPAMSVYKGYGWPKGAEDLLSSFGIKNALFSVNASHVKDDAFGKLIPCPVQV